MIGAFKHMHKSIVKHLHKPLKTWGEIAADAQRELQTAERRVIRLRGVIEIARQKQADQEPVPGRL